MSVDIFGRHSSGVKTRREIQRSLRESLPYRLSEDGNIDVENKIITNLRDPSAGKDAVTLSYMQDHCLLLGKIVDVKGRRVTSVVSPQEATDAANKLYVDARSLRLVNGAWTFDNITLTDVGEPVTESDAVNVKFMRANTVNLQNDVFTALGKRITNVTEGSESNDVVNRQQLNSVKRFAESEMHKMNSVWRYHIDKLYTSIRRHTRRKNDEKVAAGESLWTHAQDLIRMYDKEADDGVKNWRSDYEETWKEIATPPTLLEQ